MRPGKFLLTLLLLLTAAFTFAQSECQVKISVAMNKSLPPSYTFSSDFQGGEAKYYWYISDGTSYGEPTPTHIFKYTGKYGVSLKVVDPKGNVCYGKFEAEFEGKEGRNTETSLLNAKGWVKNLSSIAGCGLVIATEEGKTLLPVEMLPKFEMKEGQHVSIAFEVLNVNTICMAGTAVRIHRIAEISDELPPLLYAKGRVIDQSATEGCGLAIEIEGGKILLPYDNATGFELKEGQYVKIAYIHLAILGGKCPAGAPIKIFRIEEIPADGIFMSAKGKVVDLSEKEGCELVIVLPDGKMFVPVEIIPEIALREGVIIEFVYEIMTNVKMACQAGPPIRIHRLSISYPNTSEILYGKGVVKDMSGVAGCGMVIVLDGGQTLSPVEIIPNFVLKPGQRVELAYEILPSFAAACNNGSLVRVHKIAEIPSVNQPCMLLEPAWKLIDAKTMTYQFFAKASEPVESWFWEFGDGSTSEEAEPKHAYSKAGIYTVVCTAVTAKECKTSRRLVLVVELPGLPTCEGALSLLLYDPSAGECNGKAIVSMLNKEGVEYKDVIYTWSNGNKGNVAENLCPDKPYYIQAVIEGKCQKNTSFTFLTKPVWRVSYADGKYSFQVTDPVEGATYNWDFGDGHSAVGPDVNYEFGKDGVFSVKLTVVMGNESVDSQQLVNANKTLTGIEDIVAPAFRIYPNPASGMAYINLESNSSGILHVQVADLQGRILLNDRIVADNRNRHELDIRNLVPGLYFVKLHSDNQIQAIEKLMVK